MRHLIPGPGDDVGDAKIERVEEFLASKDMREQMTAITMFHSVHVDAIVCKFDTIEAYSVTIFSKALTTGSMLVDLVGSRTFFNKLMAFWISLLLSFRRWNSASSSSGRCCREFAFVMFSAAIVRNSTALGSNEPMV